MLISVPPRKGIKRGSLREQTKELLILAFFLRPDAEKKATTDEIVRAWDPKNRHSIGGVLAEGIGPREQFLSRAGANKICRRLASEGLLRRKPEIGYRNKKVFYYSLASDEDGFMKIARRTQNASTLLMESEYGRRGIHAHLIPKIEKGLRIDMGGWQEKVEWALAHSPTAFAVGMDDSLGDGEISNCKIGGERLRLFLATLANAIAVDRSTASRGRLIIASDENANDIEKAFRAQAKMAGSDR